MTKNKRQGPTVLPHRWLSSCGGGNFEGGKFETNKFSRGIHEDDEYILLEDVD
jgi:hypothetical protein